MHNVSVRKEALPLLTSEKNDIFTMVKEICDGHHLKRVQVVGNCPDKVPHILLNFNEFC